MTTHTESAAIQTLSNAIKALRPPNKLVALSDSYIEGFATARDMAAALAATPALPVPAILTDERRKHDIADRLSLWLSSSLDDHARQEEYRTHIRAWLDHQDACDECAGTGKCGPDDNPNEMDCEVCNGNGVAALAAPATVDRNALTDKDLLNIKVAMAHLKEAKFYTASDNLRAILGRITAAPASVQGKGSDQVKDHLRVDKLMSDMDAMRDEFSSLSSALAFWLPNVPEEEGPIKERILQDVFYLDGHGPDKSAQELGWITVNDSQASSPASVPQPAVPQGWREFIENIAKPYSEPLNSVCAYRDKESRTDKMRELRHAAQMLLAAAPEVAQPAAQGAVDPIRALIAAHAELMDQNEYCYFELARTRQTDWMAWITTKPRKDDPQRKVLARGQGDTPDDACSDALSSL
jgi:hypothetical protein